jgi:glycosyltransferase involved in cell wall biosynthesis
VRVLHLLALPEFTGPAEPVWDLVRALRAEGARVDLRIDTRRPGSLHPRLVAEGEAIADDLALSTRAGPVATARDVVRLRRLSRGYDVVHAHLTHDHALAAMALGGARRPLLVRTVHTERALRPGASRRFLLRRARALTVACERHRTVLVEAHGIDPARVSVDAGAVDAARFRPDPDARARLRAALSLDAHAFAVGSVARFQPGRRHEVMLDAVARARPAHPGMRLMLIGHGETEPRLRARAARADLQGAVVFCGYKRDDLNDWLAALDAAVWLVPGRDATSRAVLQAMAAALPVVGGNVDAIAEAVVPDETGLLVDPDDPAGLAAALATLAGDRARARAMGLAGRRRAAERFDPRARGRRVLALYHAVLRMGAPTPSA